MKKYIALLILVIIVVFPKASHAEEMVQVKLVNYVGESKELELKLTGKYVTLDPTLTLEEGVSYKVTIKDESLILKSSEDTYQINDTLILIPEMYDEQHRVEIDERPYLGAMEITIEDKKFIRPINQLPLEDYLKGVVPFEVYPDWGLETLKAQALAARTYAVSHLNKEMDDTISFQVYGGYTWMDQTTKAVNQTKGEVITHNRTLIDAFYSASNGGITENNAHVWGGKSMPYFPIKEDSYDPTHPWEFTLNHTQIELDDIDWEDPDWWKNTKEKDEKITTSMKKWLKKNGYPGEIKILTINDFKLSPKKYASERSIDGSITIEFLQKLFDGTILFQVLKREDVNLNQIRPIIGGDIFKSYLIESLAEEEEVYKMEGKGYGHGVGMSQWGAFNMGEKGKTYREIIEYYYPDTTISTY
ncbi:SpoIID/LytB domain-containing protein [Aquibacillus rhizosphaerae]|uniref:SpoIID/LytB domain-containing protein n=1 Tax=Aquibacillus rhizosphaerae TaxID=3051431 RepID=A0ABT7L1L7_9BACI|nr:SpoIID/LytB domain-containing protein [Aquibacillus sp. LR5S19]MDL4839741.1 SpoIID/LytB domain-containing protein [Aquibacillus sp. LR5S19]